MRLFLLPGASKEDPEIADWFADRSHELGLLARTWYDVMRSCGDDVTEILHDKQPTVCVDDAAFAYVAVYAKHVNVGFFGGADLEDPAALLQGSGKFMRHVKLVPAQSIEEDALRALINQAYTDMKWRVGLEQ